MSNGVIPLAEAAQTSWDVVIAGAGMGGSAAAFQLSKRGLSVLLLDLGRAEFTASGDINKDTDDPEKRLDIGRFPKKLTGAVDGPARDFYAPLGAGAGGSSLLYAAALDRFMPHDFTLRPHPGRAGETLGWPVDYAEMEPWYQRAEAALGVTGSPDPLSPGMTYDLGAPGQMSERDTRIFSALETAGLHPYRLHCAIQNRPGCTWCLAKVCLSGCKRHGGNAFLDPALATGRVKMVSGAEITRIHAEKTRVTGVDVTAGGDSLTLPAPVLVLAAGAYFSPVLLLKSTSEDWPNGLANAHDQVGRNLMFHYGRRLAVFTRRNLGVAGHKKALGFRDFYNHPEGPFGEVQSAGAEATYPNVLYALRLQVDETPLRRIPLIRQVLRLPAMIAPLLFGNAAILAVMMEDFPYPENRIERDDKAPAGMRFSYTSPGEALARAKAFSRHLKARMKGTLRTLFLDSKPHLNLGHPCGTCRGGDDPATSVTDRDGKAHGLDNLYVADASYLPTSGGTNPSLTVAANALRVGEGIAARLKG